MKKMICCVLAVLLLAGAAGCGVQYAPLEAKKDPVYTEQNGETAMDCGSFTIKYPSTLTVLTKSDKVVQNVPFLNIEAATNDNLMGSNLNVLRNDDMKKGDAGKLTQKDAESYAKVAADKLKVEAKNVKLEQVKLGDRNMAVVSYSIHYNDFDINMKQYVLMLDDCGYIFTLAAIDEASNQMLDDVMGSLTLNLKKQK